MTLIIWNPLQDEAGHYPSPWRVNTVLSNLPEFAKDFGCPPRSPLNPLPEERCDVPFGPWGLEEKDDSNNQNEGPGKSSRHPDYTVYICIIYTVYTLGLYTVYLLDNCEAHFCQLWNLFLKWEYLKQWLILGCHNNMALPYMPLIAINFLSNISLFPTHI